MFNSVFEITQICRKHQKNEVKIDKEFGLNVKKFHKTIKKD